MRDEHAHRLPLATHRCRRSAAETELDQVTGAWEALLAREVVDDDRVSPAEGLRDLRVGVDWDRPQLSLGPAARAAADERAAVVRGFEQSHAIGAEPFCRRRHGVFDQALERGAGQRRAAELRHERLLTLALSELVGRVGPVALLRPAEAWIQKLVDPHAFLPGCLPL